MTRVNDGGETTECRKVLGVSWDHRQTAHKITWAVCRCNGAAGDCHDSTQINIKALLENHRLKFIHSLYTNMHFFKYANIHFY